MQEVLSQPYKCIHIYSGGGQTQKAKTSQKKERENKSYIVEESCRTQWKRYTI